jgi:hypothetical protein
LRSLASDEAISRLKRIDDPQHQAVASLRCVVCYFAAHLTQRCIGIESPSLVKNFRDKPKGKRRVNPVASAMPEAAQPNVTTHKCIRKLIHKAPF